MAKRFAGAMAISPSLLARGCSWSSIGNGPVDFDIESEEIQDARTTAMEVSLELHDLLLGPWMASRSLQLFWSLANLQLFS